MLDLAQINTWRAKKSLRIVLSIQLAILGLIGLDALGLSIPILRQLTGFIYLTFVPGILILRILKLHKLGNIETLLYTVGLSIATLMFTGLFMNAVYPIFGINKPISFVPLMITLSIVVLFLTILSYLRDKNFAEPELIDTGDLSSPMVLFLFLLPLLSILGSQLVNSYHNNVLLIILIPILAIMPLLVSFNKLPKKLYPLAVFVISLSLLCHSTLISKYIWGWDINIEYYFANLVLANSSWDISIRSNINAMLSIVMLAPIYSLILDMNLTWVFKIVYPLLFSLLPLGLYKIYNEQTNSKISFLSCFFFVSFEFFYFNAPTGGRQEIAELFLVLWILLLVDKNLSIVKRSILSLIFMASLAVSHYGTSYLYMFVLVSGWLILKVRRYVRPNERNESITSSTSIIIFITFTLAWYMYISSSSAFNTIVHIGDHILSAIITDFLNPEASQGMKIILTGGSYCLMATLERYIQMIAQFFIVIGVIWLLKCELKGKKEFRFGETYIAFALMWFVLDTASIIIPHFAEQLNAWRIYHLTLIVLAPIGIIGGIKFLKLLVSISTFKFKNYYSSSAPLKFISIFLLIFLLFNTTWLYGIAGEYPRSLRAIALHQKAINEGDDIGKNEYYAGFYTDYDVFSVKWLSKNRDENTKICADMVRRTLIFTSYGMMPGQCVMTNKTLLDNSYLYLGYPNIRFNLMYGPGGTEYWYLSEISSTLSTADLIYNNGGAKILVK